MVRVSFDRSLNQLQDDTKELAEMVEKAIKLSVESLKNRDFDLSKQVIQNDLKINAKRYDIEEKCLLLIATQQPMASDLRTIAAVLSIVGDLERMGDHAEGIAKINLMIGKEPLVKPLIDIPKMADKAQEMLRRSVEAFMTRNAEEARQICTEDDIVDRLYDAVYEELVGIMVADPNTITRATHLLWVAHNLERIADRVTNICERVVFMVTGVIEEMNVSKY